MTDTGTITTSARRFRSRRRRFMLVGTAALAAVGIAMGISFTADTGTATVAVSPGSTSSLVYPVTANASLPAGPTWGSGTATPAASLKFGTKGMVSSGNKVSNTTADVFLPSWTPVAGTAGAIPAASGTPGTNYVGPGDLFVIDGRTASAGGAAHITVTVYATNLSAMQSAYSSFAWPVDLYYADGSSTIVPASWAVVSPTNPTVVPAIGFTASNFFLTNTGGFISYYLPTGANYFYEVALDTGGSFYTVNTGTPANLGPQFFVTAQAT